MEDNINYFDPIESAIEDIKAGKLIIVTDDANRENEGDLVMAGAKATPGTINQMIRDARGLICVPMMKHQLKRLGISQMVADNLENQGTDFSVSVDAADGISTGISAYDRAHTINILSDSESTPDLLVQPGHVFPLRAKPGGVLQRAGHTEAAVDLASLAGLSPVGVICEIIKDDGNLARVPDLYQMKNQWGIKMISIAQLIEYRHARETLVRECSTTDFPTPWGNFVLRIFQSDIDNRIHFALTMGDLTQDGNLVRVHSANVLRDLLGESLLPQKGTSVQKTLQKIAKAGSGAFIYIDKVNGGIEWEKQITEQDRKKEVSSLKMDFRDYGLGAQIISALGLKRIKLLSSASRKVVGLKGYNIEIIEQITLP